DEVFGANNAVAEIVVEKTSGASMRYIDNVADYVIWYAKDADRLKYRPLYEQKDLEDFAYEYKFIQDEAGFRSDGMRVGNSEGRIFAVKPLTSQTNASTTLYDYPF